MAIPREKEKTAKRSAEHCLRMLAPFAASCAAKEPGERAFYEFMAGVYQGISEDPERFLVSDEKYRAYMETAEERRKTAEKAHAADSKESTLRNAFQKSIEFYPRFFWELGLAGSPETAEDGALILSNADFDAVMERMKGIHDGKRNPERYALLRELGWAFAETDGAVRVSYAPEPLAAEGLLSLCKAPESKYKWMDYLRLDFQNAAAGKGPSVGDVVLTLTEEHRRIVQALEARYAGTKTRAFIKPLRGITSDFQWKVEYKRGGKSKCAFYADGEAFTLCVHFGSFENINRLADMLLAENEPLFHWFQGQFTERLCKCPYNRMVRFGKEKRRICGLSSRAEIHDPDKKDLENAFRVMEIYENF